MFALLPIALGAAGVVVSVVINRAQRQRQAESWTAVANNLGLSFVPGSGHSYGRISGRLRGIEVDVDVFVRGSGDSQAHYTRYKFHYPSMTNDSFALSKQRTFSFLGRFVGRSDVVIGDPTFDARVVIDAADPTAVDRYLSAARRVAVLRLMEVNDFVDVGPRSLSAERRRVEKDSVQLESNIVQLVDIARVMSTPSEVDLALEKQKQGDVADAVDALHVINDAQDADPNSFTQFLEAEALVVMGEGEKAAEILEDLPVFDAELGRWRTVAESHPEPLVLAPIVPQAPTSAPIPVPPPSSATSGISLDQRSVVADLFASERLSFEVEQRFFDVYESMPIEWSGVVESSRQFQTDSDFPGAGVKAKIEIGSRGDTNFVSNRVYAIVHLREGTALERNQQVGFRGTLVRADRFMQNLYVASGEIV